MEKECKDCKVSKPVDEFGSNKAKPDGKNIYCKLCSLLRTKKYRQNNPEKVVQSSKTYKEKNAEKLKESRHSWYEKNKDLVREYSKKYNSLNREKKAKNFNLWKQKNPERLKALKRKSYENNRLKEKNKKLKKNYGITLEDYNLMLASQNYKCDICLKHCELERNKILVVDHDHKTGKVRALLCDRCNKSLGILEENILLLESMISFLRRHRNELEDSQQEVVDKKIFS
jgi:hypothetical protein